MPSRKIILSVTLLAFVWLVRPPLTFAGPPAVAAQEPVLLRYDFQPGDHLLYTQRLVRNFDDSGDGADWSIQLEWQSHVVVTGGRENSRSIGFQRNRTTGKVLKVEHEDDQEATRMREYLEERLARASNQRYAEANRMSADGWPQLPWRAAREGFSELLFDRHELESLPEREVKVGDGWTAASLLQLQYRADGWETLAQEECLRVEAANPRNTIRVRYWFCPDSGLIRRIESQGIYDVGGGTQNESLTWDLVERRRDEDLDQWLEDPEVQRATLAALLVSDRFAVDPNRLYDVAAEAQDAVKKQILSLAYRKRLPPPPPQDLAEMFQSEDARVRVLAVRLLEQAPKSEAIDLLHQAFEDSDLFVREAAVAWVRSRLTEERAAGVTSVKEATSRLDAAAEGRLLRSDRSALAGISDAVLHGNTAEGWACHEQSEWSRTVLAARRFAPQVGEATTRWITQGEFRGWPYIMYVPEDYRGDEPFPLIVFLSGDSGRAMHGMGLSRQTARENGYLILYPQAEGYWHDDHPAEMMKSLWSEVLSKFNVDTNRIYLAGLSNGGTGAAYFASFWNDRFAAAVPMMGAGVYAPDPKNPMTDPDTPADQIKRAPPPLVGNLARIPLLFLHGEDDATIHPKASRDTVTAIRQVARNLGWEAPVELEILKGRGHDLWLDSDEGRSLRFFENHLREPFPRQLAFQSRNLRFPRRYWVEVLGKGEGLAEVFAEIEDDNDIRIQTNDVVSRLRLLLRAELLPRDGRVRVYLNGKQVFKGTLEHDCSLLQKTWAEAGDPFRAYSSELEVDVEAKKVVARR